jgi:hypothetical protein
MKLLFASIVMAGAMGNCARTTVHAVGEKYKENETTEEEAYAAEEASMENMNQEEMNQELDYQVPEENLEYQEESPDELTVEEAEELGLF